MNLSTANYTPEGVGSFVLHGLPEDLTVFGPISSTASWEPHLVAALRSILKPDFVCLDVGANIGAITLVLARLAYRGHIHSFEASPVAASILRRNLTANAIDNVTVVDAAVSRTTGDTEEIYTIPNQLGTAHMTAGPVRTERCSASQRLR